MSVMMITSLNTYTTNMKMQMKWQQKKTSGNFTADGAKTMEERLRKDAKEAMGDLMGGSSKVSLSQVQAKLMSGKKLSAQEMDYLRENNPELYKKAKSIEMEREAYERELKQCRTKEDVERVKMAHATAALARVKDIESNPNIPKGQKLGLIMEQLFKTKALGDVERKFMESGDYKRLPTQEEQRQAEEDRKEAQEAERGIEDKTDDTPRQVAEDAAQEEAGETDTDEAAREGASAANEDGHMVLAAPAEAGRTANTPAPGTGRSEKKTSIPKTPQKAKKVMENTYGRDIRKARTAADKTRMTRAEAEATPEARKVKRARAQAAYTKTPRAEGAAGNILDVKK